MFLRQKGFLVKKCFSSEETVLGKVIQGRGLGGKEVVSEEEVVLEG